MPVYRQMAQSFFPELHQNSGDDVSELSGDLEKMIEHMEEISGGVLLHYSSVSARDSLRTHCSSTLVCPPVVQLTLMAYDMVVLRTSPELEASMRTLEEAYRRCGAAICGDREQTDTH